MIEITKDKTVIHAEEALNELRDQFAREHCVVLDRLLTTDLSTLARKQLDSGNFQENAYYTPGGDPFAREETLSSESNFLTSALSLMLNRDSFLEAVRHITNRPEIQSFSGRIYKLHSSKNGFLDWHDDSNEKDRIVGFSLNLSNAAFQGGHFLIRDKQTKVLYKEVDYKDWGSAHIFNINHSLEHMVTKVLGEQPRITLAGWFYPTKGIKEFLSI